MTQVNGKTVLLTGGTSGIGEQLALQLKAKGAVVILTGRDEERLAKMRAEGFEAIYADLSHAAGVDALVAELADRVIDVLINNAGQGVDHDFRVASPDTDAADICIYTNLHAPVRLNAALIPRLRQRPEAVIVNVTSGLAIAPNARSPVYCATKAGLRSYTMALRAQLQDSSIHVIEALPPVVETPMTQKLNVPKLAVDECARQIIDAVEKGRDEANVGKVKMLQVLHSVSPKLARRMMIRF